MTICNSKILIMASTITAPANKSNQRLSIPLVTI
nr:MAG TPA: hypothetical protein [Caudoviricetes sp.]